MTVDISARTVSHGRIAAFSIKQDIADGYFNPFLDMQKDNTLVKVLDAKNDYRLPAFWAICEGLI